MATAQIAVISLLFIFSAALISMSFPTTRFVVVPPRRKLSDLHTILPTTRLQRAAPAASLSCTAGESPTLIPRAAVSVVVRWCEFSMSNASDSKHASPPRWLLVQRGREPNKGMWSFPGGKIEAGEKVLDAAKRELFEETRLEDEEMTIASDYEMKWHKLGAFACSDSIHLPSQLGEGSSTRNTGFHYVISQCFAEIIATSMPKLTASDDAADVRWWSAEEILLAEKDGRVTSGVGRVLERAETLYLNGLLECN